MLIRKTRRLNQLKPRLLTRIYNIPVDDLRELQLGNAVDIPEQQARRLLRHGLATKAGASVEPSGNGKSPDGEETGWHDPDSEKGANKEKSDKKDEGEQDNPDNPDNPRQETAGKDKSPEKDEGGWVDPDDRKRQTKDADNEDDSEVETDNETFNSKYRNKEDL